jgi:phage-related protein
MRQVIFPDTSKPIRWIGSSLEDLRSFPEEVRKRIGGALREAQIGGKSPFAKPLKGYVGSSVLEVLDDFDGIHIAQYTPCDSRRLCMFLHTFQRNQRKASQPLPVRSKRSSSALNEQKRITKHG